MSAAMIFSLLVVGLCLLVLELAVLPGFGVAGVLGGLSVAMGVWAAFAELGTAWGSLIAGSAAAVTALLWYYGPRSWWGRRMVLLAQQSGAVAPLARGELLGREGVAQTPLRPVGVVRFGEEDLDATTAGEFVERGTRVRVVEARGMRLVVESLAPSSEGREEG